MREKYQFTTQQTDEWVWGRLSDRGVSVGSILVPRELDGSTQSYAGVGHTLTV